MSDLPPPSSRGERRRRTKRKRREPDQTFWQRNGRVVRWGITGFFALVAIGVSWMFIIYPSKIGPGPGKEVELTFEHDEPTSSVVEKLVNAGLVASPATFGVYARLVGLKAAPGVHLLTDEASPQELVRRIERIGGASRAKVVIPEGFTRFDIAKRLHTGHVTTEKAFLDATTDPTLLKELAIDGESAEGFLFPATYDFPRDADARDIVRRLKTEFERRFTILEQNHRLGRAQLEQALGFGRKDLVTLASLVEKEAAVDEERPIIASVFLNRLRDPQFKRKVLQCDPTAGYGCLVLRDKVPACAGYAGKITHAINMAPENTYSTYVHEGLPPGPIANPGAKSLEAVLGPANTKYLYFVARGEAHRHAFSETIEEHETAVKAYKERTTAHP